MQDFAWKFSFVLFSTLGCCTRHASTHRCVSAWFRSLRWDEALVLYGS
ncbi:BgtTE-56039 [Blumeria graminis f. sp. tritici]|uniref:BgtTE-56039 n=1 Tax=Blumeria graminis f. sp. tritici TaxID=62690 RepID=A0A9X9MG22_BLUGR|nr:BgtTE-56039 [Blumeria graminis f. sp. tritici]